jgi:YVTN family beta-propeller protein
VASAGPGTISVIAAATDTVVDTITGPTDTNSVAVSPNGVFVYVTGYNPGDIEAIATSTNAVLADNPLPSAGAEGITFSPNGAYAYIANQLSDVAMVISTSTSSVVTNVPVGPYPVAVAFAPSPAVISAAPNPASGLSNTFALTYSDVYGASDLGLVGVIFNSEIAALNSCAVFYAPANNLVYLIDDAGTGSSSLTPGSGMLSNSQCTITGSGTSVVSSGDNLTLNLAVTASSTYTGTQNLFLFGEDNRGAKTGWVREDTWTPVL